MQNRIGKPFSVCEMRVAIRAAVNEPCSGRKGMLFASYLRFLHLTRETVAKPVPLWFAANSLKISSSSFTSVYKSCLCVVSIFLLLV